MWRRSPVMVGRTRELRLLSEALDAARAGDGGSVFLVGESGVGKSRLADAVAQAGLTIGMPLMRGRASSVGTSVPLRPVTEAVLSLIRRYPIDHVALGPYRAILGRVVPDWADAAPAEPASPVVLAEAVLRLAGIAGHGGGCVVTLDDLQDADSESLEVLEYLVDNLDQQPLLLVGTLLSGDCPAHSIAMAAARRGRCRVLPVHRLSRQDTDEMVAECLSASGDHLPAALLDLVWAKSGGLPFLIEELLATLIDNGSLTRPSSGWQLSDQASARLPPGFARHLVAGVDRLSRAARTILAIAALVGQRFPLTIVQAATGLSDRDLLNHLHNAVTSQFVAPDEQVAGWYTFRHRLRRDAVLAALDAAERADLALTASKAVLSVYPELPAEWCHICAELQLAAGSPSEAGLLYAEAGRRALSEGSANTAVALLDRAWQLIDEEDDAARVSTLDSLLWALAEAGLVERALASVGLLNRIDGLEPRRRIQLRARIAWAAAVAGRHADALAQIQAARQLVDLDGDDTATAHIDVVAAHLALDVPGQDQLHHAEELARRAAAIADVAPLPVVSCQAWQLLGSLTRHRDPDEATQCLERALAVAVRHQVPIEEIHALIRLGNDDALRDGGLDRLERAHRRAMEVGAVTARYQAESSLALHAILHADYDLAARRIESVLPDARRLRLVETTTYVLLLRAVLAGHRGQRAPMEEAITEALDEVRRAGGSVAPYIPRIHGLARTFCALLEEQRELAMHELTVALAADVDSPTVYHLTGRYGLDLLLRASAGDLDWEELEAFTAMPPGRLLWERQFADFARAILHGRAGRGDAAAESAAQAVRVGRPYPLGRFLGLRLIGEHAFADGWGRPVLWLRQAAEYFDQAGVPAVSRACRQLLHGAGVRVGQRRHGVDEVTESMRAAGVTAREFEVLHLLAGRLSNKEIAQRLHLSPRTVERHVSSLLQKTGRTSRIELSELAAGETPEP